MHIIALNVHIVKMFSAESSFLSSAFCAIVGAVMCVLSERIKLIRKDNKETQQMMADKLNVSQRTVANWEAGERLPSYEVLLKIADVYMVSTDYLLGRTDEPLFEHKWTSKDGAQNVLLSTTEKEPPAPSKRREFEKQTEEADTNEIVISRKDIPKNRKELEQFVLEILRKEQGKN